MDVMSCVPMSPSTFDHGPREYLSRLISLISSLRGGQSRYLPLLQTKMSEVLPNLQVPIQQSLAQQSLASARSELSRLDLYGEPSASSSTPISQETSTSPYITTPVLRQASGGSLPGVQYQDPNLAIAGQVAEPGGYPSISTAMAFQESTSTGSFSRHGTYQTHLPSGGGFAT